MVNVDLSIIIVSWNVWDELRSCLRSIETSSRSLTSSDLQLRLFGPPNDEHKLEVIVVDNASADATVSLLPSLFPWVRLITNDTNLGFTGGNNRGYAISQGEFVYFLNPDTELVADNLWQLYAAICDEPTVGMVGPYLRYGDGSIQNSRRRFPTHLTGFWESTWLGQLWPANPWTVQMHMLDWPNEFRHDVDWLVGAAMLARREALEAAISLDVNNTLNDCDETRGVGPFDERFFMYSEELDLCRRVKLAGWRIVFIPEAIVIHYEGRSSEQVVASRHIHFNTSKVRYYQKYFGERWAEALRRYLLLEFRIQLLIERFKRFLRHKRQLRTTRIEIYHEVLANGLYAHSVGRLKQKQRA